MIFVHVQKCWELVFDLFSSSHQTYSSTLLHTEWAAETIAENYPRIVLENSGIEKVIAPNFSSYLCIDFTVILHRVICAIFKAETAEFGIIKTQLSSCFRSWYLEIVSQVC